MLRGGYEIVKKKLLIAMCLMAIIMVGGCGKKEVALEPATTEKPIITLPKPVVEEVLDTVEDTAEEVAESIVPEAKEQIESTEVAESEGLVSEEGLVDSKAILEKLMLNTTTMENYKSRMVLDIDMSYAMPEDMIDPNAPTLSMSMDIVMKGDIEMNTTKEASSQKGIIETSMFGMSITIPTESYTDYINGISYNVSYEDEEAVWTKMKVEDTSESDDSEELIVSIRESIETGLVTLETTNSEYILHTEISPDAAGTDTLVGTETEDSIPIEVHFDKIMMLPTRVNMNMMSALTGEEGAEVEVNSAVFYVEFYDYGNASVIIPQEVIDSAIEE